MTQQSLEMPDGLRGPFYARLAVYGREERVEREDLESLLQFCQGGSDYNLHYVIEIGDADGALWEMPTPFNHKVSERAPAPSYHDLLETED